MKLLIVGLGLIGGSYAKGLKKCGYTIYGVDQNQEVISYALKESMIHAGSTEAKEFIPEVDGIIIALYPNKILKFLKEHQVYFKEGQIITDVAGTKTNYVYKTKELSLPAEYISHHPMAGKEKIGIYYADESIFVGANFLVTPFEDTSARALEFVLKLGNDLKFGKIFHMTPEHHDQMIAYTSQLTHAIAVSLVNSDHGIDTKNYIGDSYRDLTRIAMINETLWSQLFLENKDYLIAKIEDFEVELDLLKTALKQENAFKLEELFITSTKKRKEMEK